jgi:hypothetical protein
MVGLRRVVGRRVGAVGAGVGRITGAQHGTENFGGGGGARDGGETPEAGRSETGERVPTT